MGNQISKEPYRSKNSIFMSETLKVGIFGENKIDIIGYHTAEKTIENGLALVGDQIEVNLAISIDGLKFEAKTNIGLNIFQVLKAGKVSTGTVQLAKLNNIDEDSDNENASSSLPEVTPEVTLPKRKSVFNTRLGTAGKRKFINDPNGNDVEVSWVDIVELAHAKCGSKSKHRAIYKWTEEHVYTIINNKKCSIKNITNWEASIRQNRPKAKQFVPTQNVYPEKDEINDEIISIYSDISDTEENQTIEKPNYEDMALDELLQSLQTDIEQTAQFYEKERIAKNEGLPSDIFDSIFSYNNC